MVQCFGEGQEDLELASAGMAKHSVVVWSGIALVAAGAAVLRFRAKPLRRLAMGAVPVGALLALLGNARHAAGVVLAWVCIAWLYNR
ncbi:MAG: hypothetical protein ACUVTZ_08595 [Armatimonadota bacterium]